MLAAARRAAYRPAVGQVSGVADGPSGRILLVEDDPAVMTLTRDHLERDGFHVRATGDGVTALDSLATEPPDLVVLDLRVPGFDGFEVLAAVRRLSDVPVAVSYTHLTLPTIYSV